MKFFTIGNVDIIDLDALVKMLPGGKPWNPLSMRGRYVGAMLRSWDNFERFGVTTPLRLAHFIAQGLIETGFLRYASENLNYSAEALRKAFAKYYPTDDLAREEARQPERIANRVYGGRMGNTEPGDGWRFRGRGFLQITGRKNYRRYGEMTGLDLVGDPDILTRDLKASILVAAAFWHDNRLSTYADANNAAAVSRGINRGDPASTKMANAEPERILWTKRVLGLLTEPARVLLGEHAQADDTLSLGERGDAVRALQQDLIAIGYRPGKADGVFGIGTLRALIAFQFEQGLAPTGAADSNTLAAIAAARAETAQIFAPDGGKRLKDAMK